MLALAALMPVATVARPCQDGWAVGARRDAEGGSDSGSGRPGDHRAWAPPWMAMVGAHDGGGDRRRTTTCGYPVWIVMTGGSAGPGGTSWVGRTRAHAPKNADIYLYADHCLRVRHATGGSAGMNDGSGDGAAHAERNGDGAEDEVAPDGGGDSESQGRGRMEGAAAQQQPGEPLPASVWSLSAAVRGGSAWPGISLRPGASMGDSFVPGPDLSGVGRATGAIGYGGPPPIYDLRARSTSEAAGGVAMSEGGGDGASEAGVAAGQQELQDGMRRSTAGGVVTNATRVGTRVSGADDMLKIEYDARDAAAAGARAKKVMRIGFSGDDFDRGDKNEDVTMEFISGMEAGARKAGLKDLVGGMSKMVQMYALITGDTTLAEIAQADGMAARPEARLRTAQAAGHRLEAGGMGAARQGLRSGERWRVRPREGRCQGTCVHMARHATAHDDAYAAAHAHAAARDAAHAHTAARAAARACINIPCVSYVLYALHVPYVQCVQYVLYVPRVPHAPCVLRAPCVPCVPCALSVLCVRCAPCVPHAQGAQVAAHAHTAAHAAGHACGAARATVGTGSDRRTAPMPMSCFAARAGVTLEEAADGLVVYPHGIVASQTWVEGANDLAAHEHRNERAEKFREKIGLEEARTAHHCVVVDANPLIWSLYHFADTRLVRAGPREPPTSVAAATGRCWRRRACGCDGPTPTRMACPAVRQVMYGNPVELLEEEEMEAKAARLPGQPRFRNTRWNEMFGFKLPPTVGATGDDGPGPQIRMTFMDVRPNQCTVDFCIQVGKTAEADLGAYVYDVGTGSQFVDGKPLQGTTGGSLWAVMSYLGMLKMPALTAAQLATTASSDDDYCF